MIKTFFLSLGILALFMAGVAAATMIVNPTDQGMLFLMGCLVVAGSSIFVVVVVLIPPYARRGGP